MFGYALAYSLSREYNEKVIFDPHFLESRYIGASWTFRQYELDVFEIKKDYQDIPLFFKFWVHPALIDIFYRLKFLGRYIKESGGILIENFPKNAYLDGWFQSYKYFEKYTSEIQELFTVKIPVSKENQEMLDCIKKAGDNTVSLHVRRGDYVALSGASKWHGVCSIEYYTTAIKYMKKKL